MKKAVCIASVASNLDNFNRSNVDLLKSLGYEVTLAANFHSREDTNSQEKINAFAQEMRNQGVNVVHIDFSRCPQKIGMQIKSIRQVRKLLKQKFDLIHCHTPIASAIVRACAQKYRKIYGTKVIYTAHGFHFYTGAPAVNWIVFYSIEKLCSRWTDILITINHEDYKRAKEKFKAKKTVYVPGIGVDTAKFRTHYRRAEIRQELELSDDDFMLLSVGELNKNKNHEVVIKALSQMKKQGELPENLYYVIAGIGNKEEQLKQLVIDNELESRVRLVGFRIDVLDFYDGANAFVFPSFREGLAVSLMEAMASGLPVVCSRIRGNTDLIDEGMGGFFFDPRSSDSVADIIQKLLESDKGNMGTYNLEKIKKFDVSEVKDIMAKLYCMDILQGGR